MTIYITFMENEYFVFYYNVLKLAYCPYAHVPFPNTSMIDISLFSFPVRIYMFTQTIFEILLV